MKRHTIQILCLMLTIFMFATLFAGCSKDKPADTETGDKTTEGSKESSDKPVEYSVFFQTGAVKTWFDNPKDVVTPYVEEKFNMKIKEVLWPSGQAVQQRINQLIASSSLPEVMVMDPNVLMTILEKGVAMDLTELVPQYMPTYWNKLMTDTDKAMNKMDGKIYWVYKKSVNFNDEKYFSDPYVRAGGHAPYTREDLLKAAGYTFKPIKQIEAECKAEGRAPTVEEFQISPPIDTPEDFYNYLKKLKDLNIKVGGLDLIPWTVGWSRFHFGSMYNFGHWRWDTNLKTSYGYLGAPGAKEYFQFVNKAYNDGLLDKDFLIHKDTELVQKVSSGRVGVFMNEVGDIQGVRKTLEKANPEWIVRPIYWPQKDDNHGFYDAYVPGWFCTIIRKDVPKDTAIRLLKMWDWMYTDEGYDTLVWGPEEAGLWEMKDGKRVFKDDAMWQKAKNMEIGVGGPDEYGLHSQRGFYDGNLWSKVANCSGGPNTAGVRGLERSYPPEVDVFNKFCTIGQRSHTAMNQTVGYGVGELVGKTSTFYWVEFGEQYLPKLLKAKTGPEYDAAWDAMYKNFESKTEYKKAVEIMDEWFKSMGNN